MANEILEICRRMPCALRSGSGLVSRKLPLSRCYVPRKIICVTPVVISVGMSRRKGTITQSFKYGLLTWCARPTCGGSIVNTITKGLAGGLSRAKHSWSWQSRPRRDINSTGLGAWLAQYSWAVVQYQVVWYHLRPRVDGKTELYQLHHVLEPMGRYAHKIPYRDTHIFAWSQDHRLSTPSEYGDNPGKYSYGPVHQPCHVYRNNYEHNTMT